MGILPVYLFDEVVRLKNQAVARGMDVIDLGIGDPDFPTPAPIREAAHGALEDGANHHYSSYRGLAELRRAFAEWYQARFGVSLDPETEVVPLIGSKEGIGHIHLAYVDPGDEVLIPDPGYPTYQGGTILAGGRPRYYPVRAETGFLPDLAAIERQDLRRVRLMHINFPSNPTTATAPLPFLEQVAAFGLRHNILICHDAAYSELYFDGVRPPSFLQARDAKEIGIEFHSLSKTYMMTGWRIGVAVGNREIIAALGSVKSNYETGIFPVVQRAGIAALRGDQSFLEDVAGAVPAPAGPLRRRAEQDRLLDSEADGHLLRLGRHPGQGAVERVRAAPLGRGRRRRDPGRRVRRVRGGILPGRHDGGRGAAGRSSRAHRAGFAVNAS